MPDSLSFGCLSLIFIFTCYSSAHVIFFYMSSCSISVPYSLSLIPCLLLFLYHLIFPHSSHNWSLLLFLSLSNHNCTIVRPDPVFIFSWTCVVMLFLPDNWFSILLVTFISFLFLLSTFNRSVSYLNSIYSVHLFNIPWVLFISMYQWLYLASITGWHW